MGACWPGINIVPQVINVAVRGAQALPIGFNVNPAVILVNAQGAQAWPRCGVPHCTPQHCLSKETTAGLAPLLKPAVALVPSVNLQCSAHASDGSWSGAGASTCSRPSSRLCRPGWRSCRRALRSSRMALPSPASKPGGLLRGIGAESEWRAICRELLEPAFPWIVEAHGTPVTRGSWACMLSGRWGGTCSLSASP